MCPHVALACDLPRPCPSLPFLSFPPFQFTYFSFYISCLYLPPSLRLPLLLLFPASTLILPSFCLNLPRHSPFHAAAPYSIPFPSFIPSAPRPTSHLLTHLHASKLPHLSTMGLTLSYYNPQPNRRVPPLPRTPSELSNKLISPCFICVRRQHARCQEFFVRGVALISTCLTRGAQRSLPHSPSKTFS